VIGTGKNRTKHGPICERGRRGNALFRIPKGMGEVKRIVVSDLYIY